MTTFGRLTKWQAGLTLSACVLLCGCQSLGGGNSTGTGRSRDGGSGNRHGSDIANGDPLMGGKYIPKQDIPIPGRNELAEAKDPLLRGTASNIRPEPFRLTPDQTTAALAGTPQDNVPRLDDRNRNEASKGPVPFKAPDNRIREANDLTASIPTLDSQLDTLRMWNARFQNPVRDANGEYSFSAEIPSGDGPVRRYEGVGRSAAMAVNQVIEQVRLDRAK